MARTNVPSGAFASTADGSSACTVVTLPGTKAGNASGRGSTQVTRNGSGASAITSARPTWPAPNRNKRPSLVAKTLGEHAAGIGGGARGQSIFDDLAYDARDRR